MKAACLMSRWRLSAPIDDIRAPLLAGAGLAARCAIATLVEVDGSAPREAGAAMLVWREGSAGTIGTLGAGLHGQVVPGERTTPDVIAVHRLLAQMRDAGARHVAMEVSSHALVQGRVDAVAFQVAVFTNLTRDHLDFHGTMEAYGAAKARLFDWPTLQAMVVNLDDPFGARLGLESARGVRRIGVSARGAAGASLRADDVVLAPEGLRFTLAEEGARHAVASPLLGRFNVDNLLAVAGTLHALGHPLATIAGVLLAGWRLEQELVHFARRQALGQIIERAVLLPLGAVAVGFAAGGEALDDAVEDPLGVERERVKVVARDEQVAISNK